MKNILYLLVLVLMTACSGLDIVGEYEVECKYVFTGKKIEQKCELIQQEIVNEDESLLGIRQDF